MASPFQDFDPSIFEPLKALHIIRRVGQLDAIRSIVGNCFGLIGIARVSRRVRAEKPWLAVFNGKRRRIVQRHTISLVGQILRREPPRHSVMLHRFENESRSKRRRIAFHHFMVEAADRLHLAQRIRITWVRIFEDKNRLCPTSSCRNLHFVRLRWPGEHPLGDTIKFLPTWSDELASPLGCLSFTDASKDDCGIDSAGTQAEKIGGVTYGFSRR